MTRSQTLALSAAGLGLVLVAAGLWARFADGVFFDMLAGAVIGCLI